jgi:hypothetical protein
MYLFDESVAFLYCDSLPDVKTFNCKENGSLYQCSLVIREVHATEH